MMKTRLILSGALAILCAGGSSLAQITPQGSSAPRPASQQPRPAATEGPVTTLAGCLYREDAVPGRSPNIAEKAGVLEDYVLADATIARELNRTPDRPIADAGQPPAAQIAGLATGRMYKVTKIDDEQLKALTGKRVEITGTIKVDTDARSADRATNTNLQNIEGTSIREVTGGSCPASPAGSSPTPPTPRR
jgi:hypothetical protein